MHPTRRNRGEQWTTDNISLDNERIAHITWHGCPPSSGLLIVCLSIEAPSHLEALVPLSNIPHPLPELSPTNMAEQFPFKDKVITVTGASRGTGLALVHYLLERGATVSGCATSEANLAEAMAGIERDLAEHKNRVMFRAVDIGKPDMVKAWIEETVALHGKLDGCANVAGKEQRVIYPITDLDTDYFNDLIHTNVSGLFNCLKEEMRHIRDGGAIVNCGSITSSYASPGVAAYVAAKHALVGLTKVAAFEGAPRGVRVNALCP